MNVGEHFTIDGYQVAAMLESADTEFRVIVMHNNSSHYLVATQDVNDPEEWTPKGIAKLMASFQYGWANLDSTEHSDTLMYAAALAFAMSVVLGGSE